MENKILSAEIYLEIQSLQNNYFSFKNYLILNLRLKAVFELVYVN